jgi:hypothetical protein
VASGVKEKEKVQLDPAVSVLRHVLALIAKSPGFNPVMVVLENVRGTLPPLVAVIVAVGLVVPTSNELKSQLALEKFRKELAAIPVPDTEVL